MVLDARRLAAR